jgi:hypothetical protein
VYVCVYVCVCVSACTHTHHPPHPPKIHTHTRFLLISSSSSTSLHLVEAQDPLELEESNVRLKPYLKQLNALKASLSTQLRELEDSRAFIALGISKEASEAMIKKAYHSKAIKLRTFICTRRQAHTIPAHLILPYLSLPFSHPFIDPIPSYPYLTRSYPTLPSTN